ncbi:MAG: LysR family transcriptional regulator [Bacteroidetes bacterium]|nr:LysR family transcriptional regulator [Bacteroidota bacterium]
MTIQQLEYVVALDHYRHFVTAASRCYVTQPTLTMQVKKLEDEIGFLLFDRTKLPLKPTKAGINFIEKAKSIIREVRQLKEMVSNDKEAIEGEFTLAIIPTIAPYLLPGFLKLFTKKYPKSVLSIKELQTHEIVKQINNDQLDLGILATPLLESSIREIPVYYEPFVLYLYEGHKLMQKEFIEGKDIRTEELLLLSEGHCFREQALEVCNYSGYKDHEGFRYESGSIETIKQMVNKGIGITLIPELAILNYNDQKFSRRFAKLEPSREISIITHKSFAKESLIDIIHQTIKEVVPEHMEKKERGIRVKWR